MVRYGMDCSSVNCPICFKDFPLESIENHASSCTGGTSSVSKKRTVNGGESPVLAKKKKPGNGASLSLDPEPQEQSEPAIKREVPESDPEENVKGEPSELEGAVVKSEPPEMEQEPRNSPTKEETPQHPNQSDSILGSQKTQVASWASIFRPKPNDNKSTSKTTTGIFTSHGKSNATSSLFGSSVSPRTTSSIFGQPNSSAPKPNYFGVPGNTSNLPTGLFGKPNDESVEGGVAVDHNDLPMQPKASRLNHPEAPLAEQMRPSDLTDFIGQDQATGPGTLLRKVLDDNYIPSMILWGPPGCGKTTLANIIAGKCKSTRDKRFVKLSACTSGVVDVKKVVKEARNDLMMFKRKTILFIDEIHRFNKLQQDAFLPHVEDGTITLIGATTENPSFSLNSALLSRCQVVVLKKLEPKAVLSILTKAAERKDVHIGDPKDNTKTITNEALEYLANQSNGDARISINCLQMVIEGQQSASGSITKEQIKEGLKRTHVLYDRKGDEHYHCASALQKSIRGSDDNAALYWAMRMLAGGEDPMFIARRLVVTASEDVGLGDPSALGLAVSTMQGCQLIGRPECNYLIAQCVTHLARAKKSHEVSAAMGKAMDAIKNCEGNLPGVPLHLRNATSKLDREMGYSVGYSHNLEDARNLVYMPEGMENIKFFTEK